MQAIFFALLSYITWGVGIFFESIAARKLNSYSLIFWSFVLSSFVGFFYIPFQITNFKYSLTLFILNIALSLLTLFAGTIAYYESLKIGNRALMGTIASSFPIVTVVFSFLFLNERLLANQIIAIGIVFIGLFLSIFPIESILNKKQIFNKSFFLAIMAMVSWGMYFVFIKYFVQKVGWFWPNYISLLISPLIFLYMRMNKIKLEKFTKNKVLIPLFVSTLLVRIAEFSYNAGISKGLVAVVAPIAGANPTLFVLLAFLFLKDQITKQQIVGIITTLAGIILLSFFSV